jgi:hypothetical protein
MMGPLPSRGDDARAQCERELERTWAKALCRGYRVASRHLNRIQIVVIDIEHFQICGTGRRPRAIDEKLHELASLSVYQLLSELTHLLVGVATREGRRNTSETAPIEFDDIKDVHGRATHTMVRVLKEFVDC